jgi:hypothetical protein
VGFSVFPQYFHSVFELHPKENRTDRLENAPILSLNGQKSQKVPDYPLACPILKTYAGQCVAIDLEKFVGSTQCWSEGTGFKLTKTKGHTLFL